MNDLDLSFHTLASEATASTSMDTLVKQLDYLYSEYIENYSRGKETNKHGFQSISGNHQQTWQERNDLINQFAELLTRVKQGIDEVIKDNTTRLCFLKMNETFDKYYSNKGIVDGKWRIFQFIFLLSAISTITKKQDLKTADILHVNTGGGKSEAYFGLIVFAMFY